MTKHLKLYCYFEIDFWFYIANPKNFEYNHQILGPAAAPPFWRHWWRHHSVFVLEHNKTNKKTKDTICL
jgi:hypothetical protein